MVKFYLRILTFGALILYLTYYLSGFFVNKSNFQSIADIDYKKFSAPISIGIFGSSHTYSCYDPRIFENSLNVNAFNYGAPVQNLLTTAAVIREAIDRKEIKLGIVDVFRGTLVEPPFSDRVAAFQYETLDYMSLSPDKIKLHNQFYGTEKVLDVFPLIRNHGIWSERILQPDYVIGDNIDYYKGYKSDLYFNKKKWELNSKGKKEFDTHTLIPDKTLSLTEREMIDKIISIFRDQNVPLIFVSAPIHKKYMDNTYYTYQRMIKGYLKQKGATFIDYNDLWDELGLHLFDFKDITHVNSSGALKVSRHLATYIKENQYFLEEQFNSKVNTITNRYFQIDNNFRDVAGYSTINNPELSKDTGINEIGLFTDNYGRIEIILTGTAIKDFVLNVTYNMPQHETRNLPRSIARKISKNKYSRTISLSNMKKEGSYSGIEYDGKELKVVLVDCPFSRISNLKIRIGNTSPSTEVLSLDHLEIGNIWPSVFQ